MITTTTDSIPNKEIDQILGIARGSTVRSRNAARDLVAQLKNIIGGEIEEYTKLQAHAREQALERLIVDANNLGADAVKIFGNKNDHHILNAALTLTQTA